MEIYAEIRQKVDVDPMAVIDELKREFFGDHNRWIEKKDDKFYVMADAYHNSSSIVREISAKDVEYLDALDIIEKYLTI